MFAEPLRRAECCPIGDGAAAVVVTAEPPQSGGLAVRVAAATSGTDQWHPAASCAPDPEITRRVADTAYRLAGITADDLDLVELHDAFSVEELQYLEDLGVCPPGQAGKQLLDGQFDVGGRVAVNTSGGLIARGHPGGATGLAQIVELTTQIRGAAGQRQHEAGQERPGADDRCGRVVLRTDTAGRGRATVTTSLAEVTPTPN